MALIDPASILDASTALGAVLSGLVRLFPATQPVGAGSLSRTLVALGTEVGLIVASLIAFYRRRPTGGLSTTLTAAFAFSALWLAVILGADAVLLVAGQPRLAPAALVIIPALTTGIFTGHGLVDLFMVCGWPRLRPVFRSLVAKAKARRAAGTDREARP